jgi:hypothetical protein
VNNTEIHSELIAAGWRMNVRGHWVSPHPENAKFTIKSLSAAWQVHLARQDRSAPIGHVNRPAVVVKVPRFAG